MDVRHFVKFYSDCVVRFGHVQNPWRKELASLENVLKRRIVDPIFRKKLTRYRAHVLLRIRLWDMCATLCKGKFNDAPSNNEKLF